MKYCLNYLIKVLIFSLEEMTQNSIRKKKKNEIIQNSNTKIHEHSTHRKIASHTNYSYA